MMLKPEDVNIRVIDQRIGMGIGGMETVVRIYHIPTGLWVEVPPAFGVQYKACQIGMEMIEYAISALPEPEDTPNDQ